MFRHERPQRGRLRQFHQLGIEAIGGASPLLDVETILVALDIFRGVGLTKSQLWINSIGCQDCRPAFREMLRGILNEHLNQLCDDCRARIDRNVLRVYDCKNEGCRRVVETLPTMVEHLDAPCAEHYAQVKAALASAGVEFSEDPRLVRGLDYYTRTVYEIKHPSLGARDTICGGGRYDGLVELLGGPPTPCVGFGLGCEATLLAMEAELGAPEDSSPRPDVYIVCFEKDARADCFVLVEELRRAGLSAEMDYEGRSAKAQMRMANRLNARYCFLIGGDELENGPEQGDGQGHGRQQPAERGARGGGCRDARAARHVRTETPGRGQRMDGTERRRPDAGSCATSACAARLSRGWWRWARRPSGRCWRRWRTEGNEGARWAILNCLGQLRAREAVPALAAHLERDAFHTVAHDGLARIVGHDLGSMAGPWLKWASAQGVAGAASTPRELPDAELIAQAVEGTRAALSEEAAGRYVVEVPVSAGRSRKVWVLFGQSDHEGSPVVVVFADCGPARADGYEAALRLNLKMAYGAVALRDVGGEPQFVHVQHDPAGRPDAGGAAQEHLRRRASAPTTWSGTWASDGCRKPYTTGFRPVACRGVRFRYQKESQPPMLKRTHRCGEPRPEHVGQEVTVSGWVANWRDHGGLVFIDLRDRTGIVQVVFRPETDRRCTRRPAPCAASTASACAACWSAGRAEMENPDLPTGQVEVVAHGAGGAQHQRDPPFDMETTDEVVRRGAPALPLPGPAPPQMQRNLEFRHRLMQITRRYLDEQGLPGDRDAVPDQEHARRARAITWCPAASTRAGSTPCRRARSSSSRC